MTGKYWDEQVNPVSGCTPISEACLNCYAASSHRVHHAGGMGKGFFDRPFDEVVLRPEQLAKFDVLARSKTSKVVFVGNMTDLFHEAVPDEYIAGVFGHMHKSKHTFLVLTKRAERMKAFIEWFQKEWLGPFSSAWPNEYPTVWLGVTAENQARADERIPLLLDTPAAHRCVSVEPMLGPMEDLCLNCQGICYHTGCGHPFGTVKIDAVICGGESGPGARPMHPEWARSLKEQCDSAGARFYFKQWSNYYGPANQDCFFQAGDTKDMVKCSKAARRGGQVLDGVDYAGMNPFTGEGY